AVPRAAVMVRRLKSSALRLGIERDDRGRIELGLAGCDEQPIERQRLRRHRHREMPVARGRLQHLQVLERLASEAARCNVLVDHPGKGCCQEIRAGEALASASGILRASTPWAWARRKASASTQ